MYPHRCIFAYLVQMPSTVSTKRSVVSILRIISAAKSMLSRNAISRAGDGLPSSAASFRHAKIAAMTPRVRLRPSSISLSIGGSPQGFAAKEGNYSLLLLLPHIPKQLHLSRTMSGIQFHAVLNSKDYTVLNYEATAAGAQMAAEQRSEIWRTTLTGSNGTARKADGKSL